MDYIQKKNEGDINKKAWFPAIYKKYKEILDDHEIKYQHEVIHLPQKKSIFVPNYLFYELF